MRSVIAVCSLSFWVGSPVFGERLSSIIRLADSMFDKSEDPIVIEAPKGKRHILPISATFRVR